MTQSTSESKLNGPVLALDLGEKLVGAAISDELLITIKRLAPLNRTNWKRLLRDVETLISDFDAQTLVIGLPLRLDGTQGNTALEVERLARNFAKSLKLEVYLQDERLTSFDARQTLLAEGYDDSEIPSLIDGEAAALILRDFLRTTEARSLVISEP